MPANRKRKLVTDVFPSDNHYAGATPPPYAPSHLSMYKAFRAPLTRNLTSGLAPIFVNLVLVAGQRLKLRDFASAAAVLPLLFNRYRCKKNHRWFFTREITAAGTVILRRTGVANHPGATPSLTHVLDQFLTFATRVAPLKPDQRGEGYAAKSREAALLEKVMHLMTDGRFTAAVDAMYEQSAQPHFKSSPLVQGYLGVVALAASTMERDPSRMLRISATALNVASKLQPDAYYFVYYAAAAAMAAGRKQDAVTLLSHFVANQRPDDPVAVFGLLSLLTTSAEKSSQSAKQQRTDLARSLLRLDPVSKLASDVLQEARAWAWPVTPPVDSVELAEVVAARIEHGQSAQATSWIELGSSVRDMSDGERATFWQASGRSKWWPSHFFRVSRINGEIIRDPRLVAAKAAVAQVLMHPDTSYVHAAAASGASQNLDLNIIPSNS